jgi:hypothetical protein
MLSNPLFKLSYACRILIDTSRATLTEELCTCLPFLFLSDKTLPVFSAGPLSMRDVFDDSPPICKATFTVATT